MTDAIVSVVVERIAATLEEQMQNQVNLVRGVKKEILKLSDELKTIRNVLDDAEKKGYKDKSVKDWLRRLEDTSYEMDEVLDEWNYSLLKFQIKHSDDVADNVVPPKKKAWSFIPTSCICFKRLFAIRRDIVLKIKQVKVRLDLILAEKDRYGFAITSQPSYPSRESRRVQTTPLTDLEEVCCLNSEKENLVSKLVGEGGTEEGLGIRILSIVGVGGLGKTTLAKLAYNDRRVKNYFELKIWICVANPFDEVDIANTIIERARGGKPSSDQLDMVLHCLRESISGKKVLLVLDDVWTEDDTKWEPLKNSLKCSGGGSKVLVTTRNERVAIMMGTLRNEVHHLGHLSLEECWLLLGRIALSEKTKEQFEKFQDIGKSIANKCKGLPLAAKTLGSLLRFKNTLEEWENVLNSDIWELEVVEVDLFPHLLLSYNELSPPLKRCFSYCAVFPKDARIDVQKLITEWMAMGYLGSNAGDWKVRGREYFDKLAMLSLFQDFDRGYSNEHIRSFTMHDILHDFAQFLRKNIVGSRIKKTICQECNPLLVSQVEKYHSLFHYTELSDLHICNSLTSVRLLSLRKCGLERIPEEIEKLIHLRWLNLGGNEFACDDDLKYIFKLYNLQFLWLDDCELQEIPSDIGNLLHLIHLDLSCNRLVTELPESLCNLRELESLNVDFCGLVRLPQGIHRLMNLKHLYICFADDSLKQYPQGLAQLTRLETLQKFLRGVGNNQNKLGWLKNLNRLSGRLHLSIEVSSDDSDEELTEDAREAELRKKMHIQQLTIFFRGSATKDGTRGKEAVWIDVLDALQPHPNLQELSIWFYNGSRLPRWIASPLNQLTSITLVNFKYLSMVPPLGKLPLLENLVMQSNDQLQFIGREFLGLTTTTRSSGDHNIEASSSPEETAGKIGFPKLQKLHFSKCPEWKEWEDITAEEEGIFAVTLMPCLRELYIVNCKGLRELPHRLLRKVAAASLKVLNISGSTQLQQVYGDNDDQPWKSVIYNNPSL